MKHYTNEQIVTAIRDSAGLITTISKRLGCARATAARYIELYPEAHEALQDEREKLLDIAESKVIGSINEGDTQMAKWYLTQLGKARGYGDKLDVSGTLGVNPLSLVVGGLGLGDDGTDGGAPGPG